MQEGILMSFLEYHPYSWSWTPESQVFCSELVSSTVIWTSHNFCLLQFWYIFSVTWKCCIFIHVAFTGYLCEIGQALWNGPRLSSSVDQMYAELASGSLLPLIFGSLLPPLQYFLLWHHISTAWKLSNLKWIYLPQLLLKLATQLQVLKIFWKV